MSTHHAAIWIDHNQARVLRLSELTAEYTAEVIHSPEHVTHGNKNDGHRQLAAPRFLDAVLQAITTCDEVLVCGPASTKNELVKHIESHRPELRERILVEPADHMSDGQIADHARKVFRKADRMRGVHVS